jgi:SWI/SNF-related matrix-associated actin-dependent regulator 1 of chromatin subfamily A
VSDSIPELKWSDAQEVPTKFGPRLLRRAEPTYEFCRHFEANAQQMRLMGYTLGTDKYTSKLTACHWAVVPEHQLKERALALAASSSVDAQLDVPCPPGRALRGYQRAGVAYIKTAFDRGQTGVLLGDEMGVGKTAQSIAAINLITKIQRVLIICPAKLKDNWLQELRAWLSRKMSVGVVEGGCFPSSDIVISSFEMISKFPNATAYYWDLIIIDEAHRLSDSETIRSKNIFGWRGRGKDKGKNISPIPTRRKLALTGTPIPNKIIDIFPTLNWLDPKRWNDRFKFGLRYCGAEQRNIGRGRKAWAFDGATNQEELRQILRSSILCRRLKRDVMPELPPKTRSIIEIEGPVNTDEQREFQRIVQTFERRPKDLPGEARNEFSAAAEFFEDDLKVAFNQMSRFRHIAALAKIDPFIEDMLERMDEFGKVIIFGHHTDCIDRIATALAQFNPVKLVGNTKNPQSHVNRFQNDPACRVIIGNDSMMEGHTLTASSTVVFFEADWVPYKLAQKEDRAHRDGQRDNVFCLYYVLKNSLDARMIRRAIQKQERIEQALDK